MMLTILVHMIIVEYPVAAVLKLWHLFLSEVLGLSATSAWVGSIILLVLTIRLLLVPLVYRQYRSSRVYANLRPELHVIRDKYKGKKDKDSRKEFTAARRRIHAENNYSARDGCLPALFQMPVVIGLYRLLLRIARPQEGLAAVHQGYGPLRGEDISAFLQARFFGVPLSTYVAMPSEQLRALGTSPDNVVAVALPLIAMASVFTTANYIYSLIRTKRQLDYAQGSQVFLHRCLWLFGPFILFFPWFFGLTGPAPVALLLYWVCSNLFTIMQTVGIQLWLARHLPFTQEFRQHYDEQKELFHQRRKLKRQPVQGNEEPV